MKKAELIEMALEILDNSNDVFVSCVDELDSWNGFADGFKCYPMYELDDLFCNCKVSEFLDKIDLSNFDLSDTYFIDTIYGLQSTSDIYDVYSDNTDSGEVLDNLIENYGNIDLTWINRDLDEIVSKIYDEDYDD